MNYRIINADEEEYRKFFNKSPYTFVTQNYNWDKVKSDWTSEKIIIKNGNKVVCTALLLFKKIPFTKWKLCYIPRGPLLDWTNKEEVKICLDLIKEYGRSRKAFVIKIDPYLKEDEEMINYIDSLGYKHQGYKKNFSYINPRYNMVTDLSKGEEVFNDFYKNIKYKVRKAEKNDLELVEGKLNEVNDFYELVKTTGSRNEFNIRQKEYFYRLLSNLKEEAKLYFVRLDLNKLLEKQKEGLKDLAKEREKSKNPNSNNFLNSEKNLKETIKRAEELLKEGKTYINLTGNIMVYSGKHAEDLYAGSSNEFRNLSPNYFMKQELMKIAIKDGMEDFNFGGVSGYTNGEKEDTAPGLYEFKKVFASEMVTLCGEFDYVINKFWYFLFKKIIKK